MCVKKGLSKFPPSFGHKFYILFSWYIFIYIEASYQITSLPLLQVIQKSYSQSKYPVLAQLLKILLY